MIGPARELLEVLGKIARNRNLVRRKSDFKEVQQIPGLELAHDRGPGTVITMEELKPPAQKGTYQQKGGQCSAAAIAAARKRFGRDHSSGLGRQELKVPTCFNARHQPKGEVQKVPCMIAGQKVPSGGIWNHQQQQQGQKVRDYRGIQRNIAPSGNQRNQQKYDERYQSYWYKFGGQQQRDYGQGQKDQWRIRYKQQPYLLYMDSTFRLKIRLKRGASGREFDWGSRRDGGRIGEAKNPGPGPKGFDLVGMPEDGNCLYHGIGYQVGMTQRQVRQTLADMGKEHWGELCY